MRFALPAVTLFAIAGAWFAQASGESLVLKEKAGGVHVAISAEAKGESLALNSAVQGPKYIQTDAEGQAHFESSRSVIRLGNETSLFLKEKNTCELVSGHFLFHAVAIEQPLALSLNKQPVSISGETGFANIDTSGDASQSALLVGAMAGRVKVQLGGKTYSLKPAEFLAASKAGKVARGNFNLPKLVNTSLLVNGYKTPLPGLAAIQKETERYASLESRNFIHSRPNSQSETKGTSELLAKNGSQTDKGFAGTFAAQHDSLNSNNGVQTTSGQVVSQSVSRADWTQLQGQVVSQIIQMRGGQLRGKQPGMPHPPAPAMPGID